MQEEWLAELEAARREKPHLDLVLTHVDDRLDTGMREAIGADAARVLPLLDTHSFTFLIEDPATVWHLGPQRYQSHRRALPRADAAPRQTRHRHEYRRSLPERLPHQAADRHRAVPVGAPRGGNFQRVALYFENSLLPPDLKLLPSAAAAVSRIEKMGPKTMVDSAAGVGIPWKGGAMVDGQLWPAQDDETVWLPAGPHSVEPARGRPVRAWCA
jgi:hypothetical protein